MKKDKTGKTIIPEEGGSNLESILEEQQITIRDSRFKDKLIEFFLNHNQYKQRELFENIIINKIINSSIKCSKKSLFPFNYNVLPELKIHSPHHDVLKMHCSYLRCVLLGYEAYYIALHGGINEHRKLTVQSITHLIEENEIALSSISAEDSDYQNLIDILYRKIIQLASSIEINFWKSLKINLFSHRQKHQSLLWNLLNAAIKNSKQVDREILKCYAQNLRLANHDINNKDSKILALSIKVNLLENKINDLNKNIVRQVNESLKKRFSELYEEHRSKHDNKTTTRSNEQESAKESPKDVSTNSLRFMPTKQISEKNREPSTQLVYP